MGDSNMAEKCPINADHKSIDGDVRIIGNNNTSRYPRHAGYCYFSRTKTILTALTICVLVLIVIILGGILGGRNNCPPSGTKDDSAAANRITIYAPVKPTIDPSLPWANIRLPGNIIPSHYRIELRVDLTTFKFRGKVAIRVECMSDTEYVIVHVTKLKIDPARVFVKSLGVGYSRQLPIVEQLEVKLRQFYVIRMRDALEKGKQYEIVLNDFTGNVTDDLKGIYRSSYRTKTGQKRYLLASQLQAIDARSVFPCFDEPAMKAIYGISLIHQPGYTALSNMPSIRNTTLPDGWIKADFADTPRMSSYLLAFVISDFTFREGSVSRYSQIRIWAQPEAYNQTGYALNVSRKCYEFFTDYFQLNDTVPKSDQVASPDFAAGAMENWGLIIYRQTALLFDPERSALSNKYFVTLVVAHEVAHTWFGNMVTMKWWEDLWLNEGFASTLMYFAMDYIYPSWKVHDLQLIDSVFAVMTKDSLITSHPVSAPIEDPDDIVQFFDSISYDKGLATLRMLRGFLGWENFKRGLQKYVNRYMYRNAEMIDLWHAFEEVSNLEYDIGEIMDTWTRQMGFPVITIKRLGNDRILLEQERFLLNPDQVYNPTDSPYGYKWFIPFQYITQDNLTPRTHWLRLTSGEIYVPDNAWIVGNWDHNGFYRVNYDVGLWQKLIEQLQRDRTVIASANRAGLINDAFNLARAGKLDYKIALNISSYLDKEEDFVPWKTFINSIAFIEGMVCRSEIYGEFKKFMRRLVAPQFRRLGVGTGRPKGNLPERNLKITLLDSACRLGVPEAVQYAQKAFKDWMENGKPVEPDYALTVYATGISQGSSDEWDFLWNKSQSTNVASERETMMMALAHTREPWLLWRYANWCFDNKKIRQQDIRVVFGYLSSTPLGQNVAYMFMLTKWKQLNERFRNDNFVLRSVVTHGTSKLNTKYEQNQVEELFRKQPPDGKARNEANNALALMASNVKWMENNFKTISDWLQLNNKR
ncbi:aminopeptidase N-like [Tubulanus polymorphus]|uniref:aminopeptidase N-like n=1 Tax=Tubulanus polymorphus TaxID=672921 RepID=UPI003DA5BD01